ncbi:MAG: hypothetical protein ACK5MN_10545 [Lachnospiraceae bacterium]
MENQPKKWIVRLLEWAAMFALSAFLLRMGVAYIKEIWWILLIIAGVVVTVVIAYRLYKNKVQ